MYNSSIKNHSQHKKFDKHIEIPHKAFINDLSKNYMCEEFKTCDIVYSEIAWEYGYKVFNDAADNSPEEYNVYLSNIDKLINELRKPAFIVGGKKLKSKLHNWTNIYPITIHSGKINISPCYLYTFYYNEPVSCKTTSDLITELSGKFNKCLDFSCGYGEHLLKFNDYVGCDINKDCITYLSIMTNVKDKVKHM